MFSRYSFSCSFRAGCFFSKCPFILLGTNASFDRAELQIRQNGNGSSSGPEDMKPYQCILRIFVWLLAFYSTLSHFRAC